MLNNYESFKPDLLEIILQLEQFYMVTHLNQHGSITYANKNFLATSHWTPKRILGKTFWQMFPDTDKGQKQATDIWELLTKGKSWSSTVEKISRHNDSYHTKMMAIPIINSNERTMSAIIFEIDMTADIKLQKQLEHIAFYDYETGLMSRHNLEMTVNQLIEKQDSFAFVYLTIDRFYTIQDFHSNESRKAIIDSFISRMKRFFNNSQIARIGVNEFVVLSQFADWFIEGFNDFLKQHPIQIENSPLPISASGSIVRYPESQFTYTTLMATARSGLDEIVQSGGGKVTSLSANTQAKLHRKSLISQKLANAIMENQLKVAYQPQVDVKTGDIILYESLIRWEDDELGPVAPDELIPIAEEFGLIDRIGDFILAEAAQLATHLNQLGQPITISINASVREFINPKRTKRILEILQAENCPPELIQLEVTEIFAFKAEEENSISRQMQTLVDSGIEFALDDFGTGFASFRYMQSLPINHLKIDKVFIQSITTHEQTRRLVEGMIKFAKTLDMSVIAEGVETEEQAELLISFGIDALEGFHIGHAVTKQAILSNRS